MYVQWKVSSRRLRTSSPRQSSCSSSFASTSNFVHFSPPLGPLWSSGRDSWAQTALFQLCYHWHVFEVCRVVVKRLHQSVRLLSLCAVEQLHLIGQTLRLVNGLGKKKRDRLWGTCAARWDHKGTVRQQWGLTTNLGSISAVMRTTPFSSFTSG